MRQQDKHRKHALGEAPRLFLGVRHWQMHGHITAKSMVAPEGDRCMYGMQRAGTQPLSLSGLLPRPQAPDYSLRLLLAWPASALLFAASGPTLPARRADWVSVSMPSLSVACNPQTSEDFSTECQLR